MENALSLLLHAVIDVHCMTLSPAKCSIMEQIISWIALALTARSDKLLQAVNGTLPALTCKNYRKSQTFVKNCAATRRIQMT